MFPSVFWLISALFNSILPDASLSRLDHDNSSDGEALVAKLRAQLVQPPIAVPPRTCRTPPQARTDISPNPGAVLGARASCTGNANNFCFGNSGSYCAACGLCCIQAAGGWCCASTGVICCPAATANGGSGCCWDWQLCQSTGCVDPTVTITLTSTIWSTSYLPITVYTSYVQTILQTKTITSTITEFAPTTMGQLKMAKRTSAIGEVRATVEPQRVVTGSRDHQAHVEKAPKFPIATVPTSPNFDLLSLKLQKIGFLVKRQQTITSTVYTSVHSTTTLQSTILSSLTSTTTSTTTVYVSTTLSIIGNAVGSEISSSPTSSAAKSPDTSAAINQNAGNGLSTGGIAGVAIGSAAGSAIVCAIIIIWWRRCYPKAKKEAVATIPETTEEDKYPASPQFQDYSQEYSQEYSQQRSTVSSSSPEPYPSIIPAEVHGYSLLPYELPPSERYEMSQSVPYHLSHNGLYEV